jgi:phytoene desaturase
LIKNKSSHISIIGGGFAGLSSAALMAKEGYQTTLYEKNEDVGGRARRFEKHGFVFDMGPSWYWMPDVFEKYYNLFGHTTSDFYKLKQLDPGFTVIYGKNDTLDIPASFDELCQLFESIELGSADKLRRFMKEAEYKYQVGINNLVYKPGLSITEFFDLNVLKGIIKLQVFTSFSSHVKKYFKDKRLVSLLEFPVLFLGAMPKDTPALYSLMNYAGLKMGTFYPMGGFGKVVDAFKTIAENTGVNIQTNKTIQQIVVKSGKATEIKFDDKLELTDAIIGSADYHHIENSLLPEAFRSYSNEYWNKKTFAPSCLIYYLGINKKVNKLNHHNLFFDTDFEKHAIEIYQTKKWPEDPLFYVCCPSKTDPTVAPAGHENIFILCPIAIGLKDEEQTKAHYFNLIMKRLETYLEESISDNIIYKRSYCVSDFIKDYNSFGGNAYGLANTLLQTAIFKPKLKSKKVENLFFAGQLTVPGPGVPPSIISGQVAAIQTLKYLKNK